LFDKAQTLSEINELLARHDLHCTDRIVDLGDAGGEERAAARATSVESPASAGTAPKTAQPPSKAKRAGNSRYDWEDVAEFVRNLLREHGEFRPWDIESGWQGQADVEHAVADYMEKHGGAPAESTVRLHVRKILTDEGR
jgi:hypothetical protein